MKKFIIFIVLLFPFFLFSQKLDSLNVKQLKVKYQTFKEALNENIYRLEDLSETELKEFGMNIHTESQNLIDDFSQVFKLKDIDDFSFFSRVSNFYSIQNQPEISSYYKVLALSSSDEDYKKNIKKELDNLRELRNVSKRIYKSKNSSHVDKLKQRLIAIQSDFIE